MVGITRNKVILFGFLRCFFLIFYCFHVTSEICLPFFAPRGSFGLLREFALQEPIAKRCNNEHTGPEDQKTLDPTYKVMNSD